MVLKLQVLDLLVLQMLLQVLLKLLEQLIPYMKKELKVSGEYDSKEKEQSGKEAQKWE